MDFCRFIPQFPAKYTDRKLSIGLFVFLLMCTILLLNGCNVVDYSKEDFTKKSLLRPIQPDIEAVQLDVVYIERDLTDPLLSTLVWNEVDTVGTVDLEVRSRMRDAGFRLGIVGLTPPRSLQRLLGFRNEITDAADTSRHKEMIGRSVHLRSGGKTEILANAMPAETAIVLPGEEEPTKLVNARFVLQTELERLQDGWIKLHITPEIHHGNSQLRAIAGVSRWELKGQQEIISLRDLKFSVTLNVGEMLIISADNLKNENIAHLFFENHNSDRPQRRMVVIRLSDMKKLEPLYEK